VFDEMDCDIYQGYHFGKPMKGEEFLKLLKESRKRSE
jgi:EAL domain-containing protein (putative c-di-GMP-specific phosphodiesterase class I)